MSGRHYLLALFLTLSSLECQCLTSSPSLSKRSHTIRRRNQISILRASVETDEHKNKIDLNIIKHEYVYVFVATDELEKKSART